MTTHIGFGDYKILESLRDGVHIKHHPGTLNTMIGAGLVQPLCGFVELTDAGRKYLKKHKCPEFPRAKRSSVPDEVSDAVLEKVTNLMSAFELGHVILATDGDQDAANRLTMEITKTAKSFFEDLLMGRR